MIDFFVAGTPQTQGNKTGFLNKKTGKVVLVEGRRPEARESFKSWRIAVAEEARDAIGSGDGWPVARPVIVCLSFGLQRPASAPKRRRVWPIGARSGDVDKLARSILDAVTGVLIADDAQVVGLSVTKAYGRPGVRVQMWAEEDEQRWLPEWTLACGPQLEQGALL